jgi:hypothetical protein
MDTFKIRPSHKKNLKIRMVENSEMRSIKKNISKKIMYKEFLNC